MIPIADIEALIADAEAAQVIVQDVIKHGKAVWDWLAGGAGMFATANPILTSDDPVGDLKAKVAVAKSGGLHAAGSTFDWMSLIMQVIQIILAKLIKPPAVA